MRERWTGNWILGPKDVRQPHKTRSRGIGGPGGPVRTTDAMVAAAIEAGARGNVGLCDDPWVREAPKPLKMTPKRSKRFSTYGRCTVCVLYPKTYGKHKRPVDGSGLCLEHAAEAARKAYINDARRDRERAAQTTRRRIADEIRQKAERVAAASGVHGQRALSDDERRALLRWAERA